jgi:hypothetical protein
VTDRKEDPGATARRIDLAADELYGLALADFTSTRDARAADARRAGDRDAAKAIKALRRPTLSAWLANLLARQHGAEIELLLAIGAGLRDAQDQLAADDLRRLARQRHEVVTALGRQARSAAASAGIAVSPAAQRELAETLEASLVDESAGEALRQGRLTTGLHHVGFSPGVQRDGPTGRCVPDEAAIAPVPDGAPGVAGDGSGDVDHGSGVTDPASNDPASSVTCPASSVTDPASTVTDPASTVTDPASSEEIAERERRRAAAVDEERRRAADAAAAEVADAQSAAVEARAHADEQASRLTVLESRTAGLATEAETLRARLEAIETERADVAGHIQRAREDLAAASAAVVGAERRLEEGQERLQRLRA